MVGQGEAIHKGGPYVLERSALNVPILTELAEVRAFAVGIFYRPGEVHNAVWIGAMVQAYGMPEFVHGFYEDPSGEDLWLGLLLVELRS